MNRSPVHPNFTCNPVKHSHDGMNGTWINTNCVTLPPFATGGYWVEPYMKSPGSQNTDLAIMKSFMIQETRKLQFRLSMFDLFNSPQLNIPNNYAYFNWVVPDNATDLAQGSPQLLNSTGGCGGQNAAYAPQLGMICGKAGHREMELAVKFYF